jgi:hypothetical protein
VRCAVDEAKRQAITACGRCGQPEEAHQHRTGTDSADLDLFAALGGACAQFVASDAAVIYQKYLAIVDNREPQRQPGTGRIGKRNPLCPRCLHRHRGECKLQPGPPPGPDTLSRGAAKAREALGIAGQDTAGAS